MASRTRLLLAGFSIALVLLFLLANRAAYRSFFAEDDPDNMVNALTIPTGDFARTLVSPHLTGGYDFRATGYFVYYVLVRTAGTHYVPYVATIHSIHLINVLLLWLLSRALGADLVGACAAALLYAFHAAAFGVYWKTMYVFDLVCATFALASLLAYVHRRIVLGLIAFWLALRAKEVVILLPMVLAAYEWFLGKRQWRRLIPFFAIALIAGAFTLADVRQMDNDYSPRFTFAGLGKAAAFYAEKLALIPYMGFALLAAFLIRSSRVRFGVLAFLFLLAPMLFFSGRLFSEYLYVPLIGLAIATSAATRLGWVALFFLLWIPWNYRQYRVERSAELDLSYERRAWFTQLAAFMKSHPETDTVIWDGRPPSIPEHFIRGSARVLRGGLETRVVSIKEVTNEFEAEHLAVIVWKGPTNVYVLERPGQNPPSR